MITVVTEFQQVRAILHELIADPSKREGPNPFLTPEEVAAINRKRRPAFPTQYEAENARIEAQEREL